MVPRERYCVGFSEIQRINDEHHIYSSGDNKVGDFHHAKRVSYIIYILVTNRYCTYKELKDELDIEDTLSLYELCLVNLYNRYIMLDNM